MHGFDPLFLTPGRRLHALPMFMWMGMRFARVQRLTGPNLLTNGDFTTDFSSWTASTSTLSVSGGKGRVTGTASGAGRADQQIACIPNAFYEFGFDVSGTSGGKAARVGTAAGGLQILNTGSIATGVGYRYRFRATQAAIHISLVDGDAVGSNFSEWDNVYVRRIMP